jgi:hypothetical protein
MSRKEAKELEIDNEVYFYDNDGQVLLDSVYNEFELVKIVNELRRKKEKYMKEDNEPLFYEKVHEMYVIVLMDNIMGEIWFVTDKAFNNLEKATEYALKEVERVNEEYKPIKFRHELKEVELID